MPTTPTKHRPSPLTTVPPALLLPALLGLLTIIGPLAGLALNIPWNQAPRLLTDPQTLAAAQLSLWSALTATAICGLLGTPLALYLTKVLTRSRYAHLTYPLYALIYTPVILSPVVSGLALTYFWGRRGIIGSWLHDQGISLAFTPAAVILAQTFVGLPFFVATAVTTLKSIPRSYEEIAHLEGATPTEITRKVLLPLAAPGLATAFLLSFARALGEYGATITFAGNIAETTRTIPLNIELMLSSNQLPEALGSALMLISLYLLIGGFALLTLTLRSLRRKTRTP